MNERTRAAATELVCCWRNSGSGLDALRDSVADAVARAVTERDEEHRGQLGALRVTWEQKDRDLTMAKLTLVHAQRRLDEQAEEIARLHKEIDEVCDPNLRDAEAEIARLRAEVIDKVTLLQNLRDVREKAAVAAVRAKLDRYCAHDQGCTWLYRDEECTCGLAAALRAAGEGTARPTDPSSTAPPTA